MQSGTRGGFGAGVSGARGEGARGRGRGRGRGRNDEEAAWVPVTKLGRLVRDGRIQSLEEVYLHSLPIKEYQIIDFFFQSRDATGQSSSGLKDEVMKIMPVQKQTCAGQRTRFKAFVCVGDSNGHIGLGVKCAKEVATAIRGAIIAAKLSLIPIRRGYWGNNIGDPHTIPMKVSGKCGSVRVRLVPAPRGTQVVGAPTTKKMMAFAGIKDVFSATTGCSKTKGNFMKAIFDALSKTYSYLTPDLWTPQPYGMSPFQKHSDYLAQTGKDKKVEKLEVVV